MKTLNLKRVASLTLALVMLLAMAVPTFAANETSLNGVYTEVPIEVTVPGDLGGVGVINPMAMPVNIHDAEDEDTKVDVIGQQIVTPMLMLLNRSAIDLDVTAELSVNVKGGMYLLSDFTADNAKTETNKKIAVTLETFENGTYKDENFDEDGNPVETDLENMEKAFAALKSDKAAFTVTPGLTSKDTYVKAEQKASGGGSGKLMLAAASSDGEIKEGGVAFFRLTGNVAKKAAWAEGDYFSAKIAWTFAPFTPVEGAKFTALSGADFKNIGGSPVDFTIAAPSTKLKINPDTVEYFIDNENVATVAAKSGTPATDSLITGTITPKTIAETTCTVTVTYRLTDGSRYASTQVITVDNP